MCGRYVLSIDPAALSEYFALAACEPYAPRWNIPPGTDIPVIRRSPEGGRVAHLLRWGLVPHWAKDKTIGQRLTNARAESVTDKPAFRSAFARRRCLIPADGFYEWKAEGKCKQPYYISLRDGSPLAMAGLWESWTSPTGEILRSCAIITTAANALMQPIHDRMPAIIAPEHWQDWLAAPPEAVSHLLAPFPSEPLQAWPVDRRVSKASNDDPGLIEPLHT